MEDACSVASQHSSVSFLRWAGSAWQELNKQLYSSSFICSKACDIIAEDLLQKMRLALPANIPLALLTPSKILPCAHRANMSLDMFQKSKLVRVRKSPIVHLFAPKHVTLSRKMHFAVLASFPFWSLEPEAYLATTPFPAKHAAKPEIMMHKRIFRPHFAVSTCCTLLRSEALARLSCGGGRAVDRWVGE